MRKDYEPSGESEIRKALNLILMDPHYQKNIEYGQPRSGHPEGKVKFHISQLESNLERLVPKGVSSTEYWKLKFLIHVHDTFKAEAEHDTPILHPRNHATLARQYASNFLDDPDLLNTIQYHDLNYVLWKEYLRTGSYDKVAFQTLLDKIQNWDLFLMFIIVDGCTEDKEPAKLNWFIDEVRKHKRTKVDSTWIFCSA